MVYQTIWDKKFTEDSKCLALNKVTIKGIAQEVERINVSKNMAVVATMMEPIVDLKLKVKLKDEEKIYQGYDALIFYVVRKNENNYMTSSGVPVFIEPIEGVTQQTVPTNKIQQQAIQPVVDLS